MLKKVLASIGIGAAQVNTELEKNTFRPGEMIHGEVIVRGGDIAQEIQEISLYLMTSYKSDEHTYSHVIAHIPVVKPFVIEPGATVTTPFSFMLPYHTPLTVQRHPIYLRTGLEISMAFDPSDTDLIVVEPHPLQQKFFDTLNRLGFQLYKTENERRYTGLGGMPFVQEFEFRPGSSYYRQIEEVEVVFFLTPHGLQVFLEIDKRRRGFGQLLDSLDINERYMRIEFSAAELQQDWTPRLQSVLQSVM